MCGRFYIENDYYDRLNELLEQLGAPRPFGVENSGARDVFPSNVSPVIFTGLGDPAGGTAQVGAYQGNAPGGLAAAGMRWGFSAPGGSGLLINARAETAAEKRSFSGSLRNRRCVIPASGFYEWDRYKARFRFRAPGRPLVLLAGIYRPEPDGNRYVILTTEANRSMAPVHDRMPVMIGAGEVSAWVRDRDSAEEFLRRRQEDLDSSQDAGQIHMNFDV